jgi:hypothetical protein
MGDKGKRSGLVSLERLRVESIDMSYRVVTMILISMMIMKKEPHPFRPYAVLVYIQYTLVIILQWNS